MKEFQVWPLDHNLPDVVYADRYVVEQDWIVFYLNNKTIDRFRKNSVGRIKNLTDSDPGTPTEGDDA